MITRCEARPATGGAQEGTERPWLPKVFGDEEDKDMGRDAPLQPFEMEKYIKDLANQIDEQKRQNQAAPRGCVTLHSETDASKKIICCIFKSQSSSYWYVEWRYVSGQDIHEPDRIGEFETHIEALGFLEQPDHFNKPVKQYFLAFGEGLR
jgi:hypothetical protein